MDLTTTFSFLQPRVVYRTKYHSFINAGVKKKTVKLASSSAKESYFTYMLECRCQDGQVSYYTGSTKSLDRRVNEHHTKRGARYTAGRDCKLVFYQSLPTRARAMAREKEIKALPRSKKEELIKDVFVNEAIKDSLMGISHDM